MSTLTTSRYVEVSVGALVILGIAALLMLAMKVSNLGASSIGASGFEILARFDNVGGLKVRSPVRMSGVLIGRVSKISYDSDAYQALVHLLISPEYDLIPADSSASIYTSGLLGEQYIGIEPGGDTVSLVRGDELELTQSAIVLEQVVGQFLFSRVNETESD